MPSEPLGFSNSEVQRVRRLLNRRRARHDEETFVVEGPVLVGEVLAAGWPIEAQFVAPGVSPVGDVSPVRTLAPGVAERIAATEAPPGLFAIVAMPERPLGALTDVDLVVVADGVSDPGNLGTIVRSAEAAGAGTVALTPGTVDVFNPKVVRASAGALFHVMVIEATLEEVRGAGLRLIGTSSHAGARHTDVDWSGRVAIVVGSEAHGLDADASVDDWVRIEHRGRAESLNVAMATTVLLFTAAAARR